MPPGTFGFRIDVERACLVAPHLSDRGAIGGEAHKSRVSRACEPAPEVAFDQKGRVRLTSEGADFGA